MSTSDVVGSSAANARHRVPDARPLTLPAALVAPERLWTRDEVLARDGPVPRRAGVYGWYFREVPPGVPTAECVRIALGGGATLLYVGISPKRPPANGRPPSRQRLRDRVGYHYRGNAAGSTLRLTLGCLLADELGLALRRVGSGGRRTFADGERRLSDWMGANALVTWVTDDAPWLVEERLIGALSLPLNLERNAGHPFAATLVAVRRAAKTRAEREPMWGSHDVPRSSSAMSPTSSHAMQPVVAAVVVRGGAVLLGRRPAHKRHGGLWEFPGGKLEAEETHATAAARELREELGLTVTAVGAPLYTVRDPGSPFEIAFVPLAAAGEPVCHEHTAIAWVPPAALADLPLAPSDARFAQALADGHVRLDVLRGHSR